MQWFRLPLGLVPQKINAINTDVYPKHCGELTKT